MNKLSIRSKKKTVKISCQIMNRDIKEEQHKS